MDSREVLGSLSLGIKEQKFTVPLYNTLSGICRALKINASGKFGRISNHELYEKIKRHKDYPKYKTKLDNCIKNQTKAFETDQKIKFQKKEIFVGKIKECLSVYEEYGTSRHNDHEKLDLETLKTAWNEFHDYKPKEHLKIVCDKPCIYMWENKHKKLKYVGQTTNLNQRTTQHVGTAFSVSKKSKPTVFEKELRVTHPRDWTVKILSQTDAKDLDFEEMKYIIIENTLKGKCGLNQEIKIKTPEVFKDLKKFIKEI
jgi:hypothetical protein